MLFPLHFRPSQSYHQAPRNFGSNRDYGTRKHAGCDLYAPVGTPILAVEDGTVLDVKAFYDGTWYVSVDHDDFVVRYGEVSPNIPKGIRSGVPVRRGQIIAHVGFLVSLKMSMLHFEMYDGSEVGPLTTSSKPYRRRKDLIDPTTYLDEALVMAGGFGAVSEMISATA